MDVAVPRDRNATSEPVIIPKGVSRFTGFDDNIISMYARGMTTRDIQGHLEEIYGVEVSPTLISQVTDAVTEGAKLWLLVVTELKNRGVKDIFIACVDGLKAPGPGHAARFIAFFTSSARRSAFALTSSHLSSPAS